MTLRIASSTNSFLPMATGVIIGYIRDPKRFRINDYTQYLETKKRLGIWWKLDRDASARYVADADSVWADGDDSPKGDANQMRFEAVEFQTTRRAHAFRLGDMAIEAAGSDLPLITMHAQMVAQQAMTQRTARVIALLEAAGNWGSNTASANVLNSGAGAWDTASGDSTSPNYNAIKKAILEATIRINLATNALVQPEDLVMVISPGLATKMANTSEIHDYLKYGPFSRPQLEGKDNNNATWGLPPSLYGMPIIVENAVRVSTRPAAAGTAGTRATIKADSSAVILSRKGGIDGVYGSPSYSTLQVYFHGYQMAAETLPDPFEKRTVGRVVEDYKEVLAAPETGFLISAAA